MGGTAVHAISIPFAVAAGSGASLSAYLSWRVFRDSPVSHVMGALAIAMAVMTFYHVLIVVYPGSVALELVGGGKYIALLGILGILVSLQRWTTIPLQEYDSSFLLAATGTGVFVGGGLLSEVFAPQSVHWVHMLGAVLILIGFCRLVRRDSTHDHWFSALVADPERVRSRAEWMNPLDDRILEVCSTSDLVLTPAIIAYNTGYSRGEVNRRLSALEEHSLLERVDRGKYRITCEGRQYLYSVERKEDT
ncbi:hypothetical protein [Natrononativus amylolyticus]|uniref:hypothetical protein n=1 Tax=Natrononativus amylolyticus TaxID=2963434 RepID=UPI0020CCD65B|nr:hypothetical protein [Natrononativus amylolyticus]